MPAFGFDPSKVPESEKSFNPVPAGDYKVVIEGSEEKLTNDNKGSYISFTLKIIEGNYAGRKLFDMAMIKSERKDEKMQTALQIAREKIAEMCRAAGKPGATNSEQLYQIPLNVTVKVKKDPEYGDQNEIKKYKSAGAAQPPMGNASASAGLGQNAAAQQSAASPSNGQPTPPWERGAA